ncbi:MAG: hypothetical protein ACRD4B_01720, partial [Acidobacteriota bacterium]
MIGRCFLSILCLIFACASYASSPEAFPCETSPEIQTEIDFIHNSAKKTQERLMLWKNLLKKHPQDLFVHRAYQDDYRYYSYSNLPQLIAEYH